MKKLREIMREGFLFAVRRHATVSEAARTMAEHNVGIVAVLEGDRLVGVFSERDVVRRVIDKGLDPKTVSIEEVMTRDLLVADERNPRSIVFQLVALAEHVASLPRDGASARRSVEERVAFEALSEIRLIDVETICALADQGRPALAALLRDLVSKMQGLSEALFAAYLTPATISRALSAPEIGS